MTPTDKKDHADRIIKDMKELHSSLFTQATSYTNTVILAGYAGSFGIWGLTKDRMTDVCTGIIGILLAVSVTVFVTFEIYKMIRYMGIQVKFVKSIQKDNTPDNIIRAFAALKSEEVSSHQAMMTIWFSCFVVALLTGFSAALILLWGLVQMVVKG